MIDTHYILSIKHTASGDDYITLWRPNDAGYTLYLPAAGKYSIAQIEANPGYYNNGRTTVAIPCHIVDGRGVEAADGYDCAGPVIKNTGQDWSALMAHKLRSAQGKHDE